MSLNFKERELVAVVASVAVGCKPCLNYHFKKVREAGASNEEIKQVIEVAISVLDSAKRIMEANALKHLGLYKILTDIRVMKIPPGSRN